MTVLHMRSEAVETDRTKIESRQSIDRRRMPKKSTIVNGADQSLSYAAEDESVVRQINLAAAFHDHISCTKSAELSKIDGSRVPLPCETDHIYANCSGDVKNKSPVVNASANHPSKSRELTAENKRLKGVLFVQLELIKHLEEEIMIKDRQIMSHKLESDSLRARLDRRERMCVVNKSFPKPEERTKTNISEVKCAEPEISSTSSVVSPVMPSTSATTTFTVTASTTISTCSAAAMAGSAIVPTKVEHSSTVASVNLVTRYFGRRSKTIPSRALKRRYLGPPKPIRCKQPALKSLSSATSVSSGSELREEEMVPKTEAPKETQSSHEKSSITDIKIVKKRGKKPKGISKRTDFLMTDEVYFLPDNRTVHSCLNCSQPLIDVPSWKLKPVTSFYQMEGTENINDPVFQRRHLKCEQDERRRKRWDIQRLREQKASEKLKYKYCRDTGKYSENNVQRKSSFYPDLRHIQYIEVSNQLPVLAFGHLIPLFQPSDFALPWKSGEISQNSEPTEVTPNRVGKKSRLSSTGPKVT